jgi:hypothetical protein
MKIKGKIYPKKKNEKYHSVIISELRIYTQGVDVNESLLMAKDSIEELLEIKVEVKLLKDQRTFTVTTNQVDVLIQRIIEVNKEK